MCHLLGVAFLSAWFAAAATPVAPAASEFVPPMPSLDAAPGVAAGPAVRAIGFAEAIERAMAFNVQAATSIEDVAIGQATTSGLRAAASPNIFISATYTRLDHKRALAGRTLSGRDQVNGYIGIYQPLLAPRAWGNISEAKSQEKVLWATHRNTRRTVAVAAANAYLDVLVARRGVEVGRSASATDLAHLEIAQARLKAGISNRLDALRAEDELAQSQAQLAGFLAALARSQEQLGVQLGLQEPVDVADDAALLGPTVAACADPQAKHLAHRADLALTQEQLVQAQRVRRHNWLDFMPAILATGQLFTQDPATPSNPKVGWQIQAIASVPIWDSGTRLSLMRNRWALERQASYRLEAMERQAHSEVRSALAVLEQAEEQLNQANRSAAASEASVQLTTKAYRGGALGNLEVVDAERRDRDAQIRKATAEDALRRARLDLVVAAGKFPE